jgi:emp24/gp25L/p24 family/GOLD
VFSLQDLHTGKNAKGDAPTYVTLLERPAEAAGDKTERRPSKPKPVSQQITETSGSFVQRIYEDSAVDVCIRASGAGQQNPMRFHLRLEELGDDLTEMERKDKASGVEHRWSFMEMQMDRIEHEMHTIIREADFFKERDAAYHQHTDDLHKATLFWPILHVGILLLTGFTQANHIVRFFKTRRII